MPRAVYHDTWVVPTPSTSSLTLEMDSTPKKSITKRSLPTPNATPTRPSRSAKPTVDEQRWRAFTRSGSGSTEDATTFREGDIVIISQHATTRQQSWLKSRRTLSKNKSKLESNGLSPGENVAVIRSFYEENRGEMRSKIQWLANPTLVWQDGEDKQGETWEKNELYYTTDSMYLDTQSASPSTSRVSAPHSHATGAINIRYILRHALILDPTSPGPSSADLDLPSFIVKKLYDTRPLQDGQYIGPIDWQAVYARGKDAGEWDVEGFPGDTSSDDDDAVQVAEKRLTPAEIERKRVRAAKVKKEVDLAKKARKVQQVYGSDDESDGSSDEEGESSGSDGSGDNFEGADDCGSPSPSIDGRRSSDEEEDDSDDPSRLSPTRNRHRATSTASPTKRRATTIRTPRSNKKIKSDHVASPSEKKRLRAIQPRLPVASFPTDLLHLNANPFQLASARLHASATPENLTGREDEQDEIRDKVGDAIRKTRGELFFISGVPGTGKTATVYSALRSLSEDEDVDSFEFVEINGMKIPEPNHAFSLLWEALSGGEKIPHRLALARLEKHFATPSLTRRTTVVLVDELDQMVTKKQDVIYNFFNWPHMAHSKLIVIAIANTMDLPERELSGKIRSRLGSNRINFKTYSISQLEGILHARMEGLLDDVIEKDAITFAAKKVGTVSGDARRVLDICRRSIEKVDQLNTESLSLGQPTRRCGIRDVLATYKEMTDYGSNAFMKEFPLHSKIMLLAVVQCVKKAGVPEVEFNAVLRWHLKFCEQTSIHPIPSHDSLFTTLSTLHTLRILVTESQRLDYYQRVRSLVADSDVFAALESEPLLVNHLPGSSSRRR